MNKKLFARAEARWLARSSPTIRRSRAPAPSSARPCTGSSRARSRSEVLAAGFKLVAAGEFLRHPEDPREEQDFRPKVPVDEFVLKFRKPS